MKTIGLLGGMSWESSYDYYRIINEETRSKLGGAHSSKCVMYSFNFHEIEQMQHQGKWDDLTVLLTQGAQFLANAAADFFIICSNTMHFSATAVAKKVSIPLLHIVDATAESIQNQQISKVGLLGTKFTMEQSFYRELLQQDYQIETIVPPLSDREIIHAIIYNELIKGIINKSSQKQYLNIINNLKAQGAEGVIMGCTEIPLLLRNVTSPLPLFDTTLIHAQKAVAISLSL